MVVGASCGIDNNAEEEKM